jgi:spore germination protein YaaH
MKRIAWLIIFIFSLQSLFSQEVDTVIGQKFVEKEQKVTVFKEKPDNFLGKVLYHLTPVKKKISYKTQKIYEPVPDTQIIVKEAPKVIDDNLFQKTYSTHMLESEKVSSNNGSLSESQWDQRAGIVYLPPVETKLSLSKIVYGFHPYWLGSSYKSYAYSLLSRVGYFSYEIDGNGNNINGFPNWDQSGIFELAQKQNTKVDIVITCFGAERTTQFLNNQSAQDKLIQNILGLLKDKGDGVNIDFEGMSASVGTQYNQFIEKLSTALKQADPSYKLSVCIPAIDWTGVFSVSSIKDTVDYFIMMGYDFSGKTSTMAMPNAPLSNSFGNYNIETSINEWIGRGLPQNKLILGVPYYGHVWETEMSTIPSNVKDYKGSRTFRNIITDFGDQYKLYYDSTYSASYVIYRSGENWTQCWFDGPHSLRQKYRYVKKSDLAGISIWALGYDNGFSMLWDQIRDEFTYDPNKQKLENEKRKQSALQALAKQLDEKAEHKDKYPGQKSTEAEEAKENTSESFAEVLSLAILLLTLFGLIGFILSLFDYNVREVLFSNNFRVVLYFLLVFLLFQILLRLFNFLDDIDILFIIGITVGIGVTLLVLRVVNKNNTYNKKLTP